MSNRNFLFVALALQNGIIRDPDAVDAFDQCFRFPDQAVDEWLVRQSHLVQADVQMLNQLLVRRFGDVDHPLPKELGDLFSATSVKTILQQSSSRLQAGESPQVFPVSLDRRSDANKAGKLASATGDPKVDSDSNRFRILKHHAQGGLGVVYLAEDTQVRRQVAIKQIRDRHADVPAYREKFRFEAEVTGQLEHPGIVPIYALGDDESGRPYYAMRFIKGESLGAQIEAFHLGIAKNQLAMDGPEFRQLMRRLIDVCEAVGYAHQRGVLHRDLKPGNIMLGKFGETLVVDWGLAKRVEVPSDLAVTITEPGNQSAPHPAAGSGSDSETKYGSFLGTAAYASPEQLRGQLDRLCVASDVFSAGAILYQMIFGTTMTSGATDVASILARHQTRSVTEAYKAAPASLRAIAAICMKATAYEIADRYQSIPDLKDELLRWLDDQPLVALPDSMNMRLSRWVRRHRSTAFAVAASLLVLAISGVSVAVVTSAYANSETKLRLAAEESQTKELAARLAAQESQLRIEQSERDLTLRAAVSARQRGQFATAAELMTALENSGPLVTDQILMLAQDHLFAFNETAVLPTLQRLDLTTLSPKQTAAYQLILGDHMLLGADDQRGIAAIQAAIDSKLLDQAEENYALGLVADTPMQCTKYLSTALALQPFHPIARIRRAMTNIVLGLMSEARRDMEFGLAAFPNDLRYTMLAANIEALNGNEAKAREIAERVVVSDPSYKQQLQIVLSIAETQSLLNNFDRWNSLTFYSEIGSRFLKLLSAVTASDGPGIPRAGWGGGIYEMIPKSSWELALFVANPVKKRQFIEKLADLLPQNQLVQYAQLATMLEDGDAFELYQLAKLVTEADSISNYVENSAIWWAIFNLTYHTLNGDNRCEIQPLYFEMVAKALHERERNGRFILGAIAPEQAWMMLISRGFYGPALLLAQDELGYATGEAKKAEWQQRTDLSREFERRLFELSKETIGKLAENPANP